MIHLFRRTSQKTPLQSHELYFLWIKKIKKIVCLKCTLNTTTIKILLKVLSKPFFPDWRYSRIFFLVNAHAPSFSLFSGKSDTCNHRYTGIVIIHFQSEVLILLELMLQNFSFLILWSNFLYICPIHWWVKLAVKAFLINN